MKDFGVRLTMNSNEFKYICSCGNKWIGHYNQICSCGNTDFKSVSNDYNGGKMTSGIRLKHIDSGTWGFIVEKVKTNGIYNKKEESLILTNETKNKMVVDFRTNTFQIHNKNNISDINVNTTAYFFRDIHDNLFIDTIKNTNIKEYLRLAKETYGKTGSYWYSSYHKLSVGLAKIINREYLQILLSAGYNYNFLKNFCEYVNPERGLNKPHEIIGVPKYIANLLRNNDIMSCNIVPSLNLLDAELGAENIKYIFEKFNEESTVKDLKDFISDSTENFLKLTKDFGYKPKRLIDYLCRDVKLQQGITKPKEALTILKDYNNMMHLMEQKIDDKYSKSLKKDHDIATMNYEVNKNEYTKNKFEKIVETNTYKECLFEEKKYIIVNPKEPSDLIKEGKNLSHCVASYVNDVINEKCKIYFMREKEKVDEPLLTIEVRNNKVIQVKGFGNRLPLDTENEFLLKWVKNKNLQYSA